MEEGSINLIVEDNKDKTFLIKVPSSSIKSGELREILKKQVSKSDHFYFIYKNKKYTKNDLDEILNLKQGERINLVNTASKENITICNFHKNLNLSEADMKVEELSGILHLCNLKNIARYIDLEKIKDDTIREIMRDLKDGIDLSDDPQEDIKELLTKKDGNNILTFINYLNKKIKNQDVEYLIGLIDNNKRKDIKAFWSILSKYQDFNELFEKDFSKMIENSYIDYSLVSVQIYQQKKRKEFIQKLNDCPDCEVKYLLHGTQIDPISKILTGEFKYTKKAFYGMGVYFTDMIDYVSFYCGGDSYSNRRDLWNKIIPIGDSISCVASEVFYDKGKKKKIYQMHEPVIIFDDFPTYEEIKNNYEDQMVEKNGINFIEVETIHGHVLKSEEDIDSSRKNGRLIGKEYVITEMEQILPLYGLTLKRNEYLVIWRDPCFDKKNEWDYYLEERKMFIYKESKMNAFFVGTIEKGLEIILRKRYNKIILISNIGLDLSGKKFVEVARKILGFNVMVLFFSKNKDNFECLKKFPNALFTNKNNFYEKYVTKYNKKGLNELKKEVEKKYKIKLNFTDDFMKFPNFNEKGKYKNLIFNEINENFRRVMIISIFETKALYMNDGKVSFKSYEGLEASPFIWYITIIDNEITLYSNEFYLDADKNERIVKGFPYMKRWKCEFKANNYSIYFEDKNNMLTIDGDNALLRNENENQNNQLFNFIDIQKK
jgi:hypothetical protein